MEFFQVPEHLYREKAIYEPRTYMGESSEFFYIQGHLCSEKAIYMTNRTYILPRGPRSNTWGEAQHFFSPRAYMGEELGIFSSPRSYIEGESSEFFQVPGIYEGI